MKNKPLKNVFALWLKWQGVGCVRVGYYVQIGKKEIENRTNSSMIFHSTDQYNFYMNLYY